jgi:hypothetical protein
MNQPRRFHWDLAEIDSSVQIDETAENIYISPVTFAREGVFPYEDGRALKPGDELAKAAAVSRMYVTWGHPPFKVVTNRDQIKGVADSLHVEKDGKGVKVKGRLVWYKQRMTVDQQELTRSAAKREVSVGQYCVDDRTPGTWNGQPYDYVQRQILFDHVATVDLGRCSYPNCGIGVDQAPLPSQAGAIPTQDYNQWSYLDPKVVHLRIAASQDSSCGQCIFYHQGDNTCQIVAGPVSANLVCDQFLARRSLAEFLTSMRGARDELHGDLVMKEEEEVSIEEDAQLTAQQKNRLPDSSFAYISPDGKRKLPIHDRRHVIAALNAVQNWSFRGQALSIPRSAKPGIKRKVCAAARRFGVKSAFCGTADSATELMRNLMAMDRADLVAFHRFVHRADDYVEDGPIHRAVLYVLHKKAA